MDWNDIMNRHPGLGHLAYILVKAQPEDIRRYVSHMTDMDKNKGCMNDILRSEILERIVDNAAGM